MRTGCASVLVPALPCTPGPPVPHACQACKPERGSENKSFLCWGRLSLGGQGGNDLKGEGGGKISARGKVLGGGASGEKILAGERGEKILEAKREIDLRGGSRLAKWAI